MGRHVSILRLRPTSPACPLLPRSQREVLFAPLTCIELRNSHAEGGMIVLEMSLSINLMAPTIEKVISKPKHRV